MIVSEPLSAGYRMKAMSDPRNFDIFDFVCNGTELGRESGQGEEWGRE